MKNRGALTLLLTANIVSGFAQGISMMAIPWYFTDILKISSSYAVIYAVITIASLFWNLYAGTLIDRYPRKNIFLGISLVCGIILLSVSAFGYYTGNVPVGLAVLVFGLTIFNYNIHYPALYAFGQEITEKHHYGRINSYIEIQGQATTILSGAFATILLAGTDGGPVNVMGLIINIPFTIQKWDLHEIFLMDAITYFIAIALISFIKYTPQVTNVIETGKIFERIKTGFTFLKDHPLLFIFGNASFSIFVVLLVEMQLLLPMYVSNHLNEHADVYASSEIYYAVGALLAGLGIRWLFRNTNTVLSIIIMMLFTAAGLYWCAFTKSTIVFYVFSFVIGITNAGSRVLRTTYLFHHIPNQVIGRVNSVFSVINILFRFSFGLIFALPFFSAGSNVTWAYFTFGCFVLISALVLVKWYTQLVQVGTE